MTKEEILNKCLPKNMAWTIEVERGVQLAMEQYACEYHKSKAENLPISHVSKYEHNTVYIPIEKYSICKEAWMINNGLQAYPFPLEGLCKDYYNDITMGYFALKLDSINGHSIEEYAKYPELDWLIELIKMPIDN